MHKRIYSIANVGITRLGVLTLDNTEQPEYSFTAISCSIW